MKIPLLSRGLKLPNSKPGCRVSAPHFFVKKKILPMAFWHRGHSDECLFQLLIPGLTPVSLLESELRFEIVTLLEDSGKRPFSHISTMAKSTNCLRKINLGKSISDKSLIANTVANTYCRVPKEPLPKIEDNWFPGAAAQRLSSCVMVSHGKKIRS